MATEEVTKHSVHTLVFRSLKRTSYTFLSEHGLTVPQDNKSDEIRKKVRISDEYGPVLHLAESDKLDKMNSMLVPNSEKDSDASSDSLVPVNTSEANRADPVLKSKTALVSVGENDKVLVPRKALMTSRPNWHAPWKLFRVISGHIGWVRCLAVEPGNQWFASGAADRVIKIWDLASGVLKLSLTGHISTVRGLKVSARHPFLFSVGEDKTVKCWDLEYNKVIRDYHGHLSAATAVDLHPAIDVLVTSARDSTVRVWDMRTKANIHTLVGHTSTVADVRCQANEPQIISGSHDCTVRLWDICGGKSRATLTNHKKSVRALTLHPTQFTFGSASQDNIKQWKFPEGQFLQNLSGHNSIKNALVVNPDGVLVSGGDNGTLCFWDWRTGYKFQQYQAPVQPGSLDSESGIFALTFDKSYSRLLTGDADKTIKIYKEDESATEESHPLNWRPEILKRKNY